jgi:hypothetical protein
MDKWVGDVVALERLLAQSRVANLQASVALRGFANIVLSRSPLNSTSVGGMG